MKHHVISILGVSRALPFGLHVYGYVVTVSMCTNNSVLTDLEWVFFFVWCTDEITLMLQNIWLW